MSEFEVGDRVLGSVTWFREGKERPGLIIRDDGTCRLIKIDK